MAALTDEGLAPAGFDAIRFQAAAAALAAKREQSVARAWPSVFQSLAPRFHERFASHAASTAAPRRPAPPCSFALILARSGELPDAGRLLAVPP